MSAQLACKKCGKALEPAAIACSACGAIAGTFPGTASVAIPDIRLPGAPDFGASVASAAFAPIGGVPRVTTAELNLNFVGGPGGLSRPYKPVFAVGRREDRGEELPSPFALAPFAGTEFLVLHFLDDGGRSEIWRCSAEGVRLATIGPFPAGSGEAALDAPSAVATDGQSNVYVLDMGAGRVKKFSGDGRLLACFGTAGSGHEQLETPQGLAVDEAGNLFVADTGNNRILKWDAAGRFQLAIGIDQEDSDAGGLLSGSEPGELDEPQGICLGADGAIYVADSNNHRIQIFSPEGTLRFAFGEEGSEPGRFYYPRVVRVNRQGDVFVADSRQGRVQKFNSDGQFVYQVLAPADAGLVDDFLVDSAGRIVLALRKSDLVLGIEIE